MVSLLSVHIPKTAGTSFRIALEQVYGRRLVGDYADTRESTSSEAVVHGHVWPGKYEADMVITWVRDPIERLISHHAHYLRCPDPNNALACRVARERMPLDAFAELPEMRNFMMQMFGPFEVTRFAFIGICESFDMELSRLSTMLEWPDVPAATVLNVNPRKELAARYPISSAFRFHLESLNREDYRLYRYATFRRLRERVSFDRPARLGPARERTPETALVPVA